jgi:hypothetical protein
MQHGNVIGGPIGAADDTEIKCKGTAGEIGRDLPAEKGSFRRIAMWTISLNALLALGIGCPVRPFIRRRQTRFATGAHPAGRGTAPR